MSHKIYFLNSFYNKLPDFVTKYNRQTKNYTYSNINKAKCLFTEKGCTISNYMDLFNKKDSKICIAYENELRSYCEADLRLCFRLISAFVFATRIVQFLYFLNPKFQAPCHLLCLYSSLCVRPGRKPQRPVFSRRGGLCRAWSEPILLVLSRTGSNITSVSYH